MKGTNLDGMENQRVAWLNENRVLIGHLIALAAQERAILYKHGNVAYWDMVCGKDRNVGLRLRRENLPEYNTREQCVNVLVTLKIQWQVVPSEQMVQVCNVTIRTSENDFIANAQGNLATPFGWAFSAKSVFVPGEWMQFVCEPVNKLTQRWAKIRDDQQKQRRYELEAVLLVNHAGTGDGYKMDFDQHNKTWVYRGLETR